MTPAEIAEVEARFQAGTHTDVDFRALLSAAKSAPTVPQVVEMLHEAGREFDRITGDAA
ncbi:hypothetical protein [Deinococcus alpinitundrae]|uniref:hypothetical protein n=1 Tax=Deinococcus alpinitundrae TaxID=468913 RepID=UPI001ED95563|nr:hypothetical protein [Deinococcus alpinitundrae]